MSSFFRHRFSTIMLLQLSAELGCLFLAGIVAVVFLERITFSTSRALAPQLAFAVLVVALNIGFGIYRRIEKLSSGPYLIRLFLSRSRPGSVAAGKRSG